MEEKAASAAASRSLSRLRTTRAVFAPSASSRTLTLVVLLAVALPAAAWTFTAAAASDLQPAFNIAAPWLGADVSTSVPLGALPGTFLWLHGDTLTGRMVNGVRAVSGMPRNSIAVVNVSATGALASGVAHYLPVPHGDARHDGWWSPTHNLSQWYWPTVGLVVGGDTYVIAMRVEDANAGSLFPFATAGMDVLALGRPTSADPRTWRAPVVSTLPPVNATFGLGSAAALAHGFVYILGSCGSDGRSAMMARIDATAFAAAASAGAAADWGALRYLTRGAWAPLDARVQPDALFAFVPSETTLFWHDTLQLWYVVVANTFVSRSVYFITAPAIEGPWTSTDVYAIPEEQLSGGAFCYAGKAHPELSAPGALEVVFSYMCNTPQISELLNRTDVYVPQLIRAAAHADGVRTASDADGAAASRGGVVGALGWRSLLLHGSGPSERGLWLSPLHYNHVLDGPAWSSPSYWYLTQWSAAQQLNASDAVAGPGPCPASTAWVTLWHAAAAGQLVCMQADAATQSRFAVLVRQDGSQGGLACGEEVDAFVAPTDGAYANAPQNINASTPLASLAALNVTATLELLSLAPTPRCGPAGSCGPSGKLDYAYVTLGIVLSAPGETIFYQLIFADTRGPPSCAANDPCGAHVDWYFDSLPTLGVSESIAHAFPDNSAGPCMRPGGPARAFVLPMLPRLTWAIAYAASHFNATADLTRWSISSVYLGAGLEGSVVTELRTSNVDVLVLDATDSPSGAPRRM